MHNTHRSSVPPHPPSTVPQTYVCRENAKIYSISTESMVKTKNKTAHTAPNIEHRIEHGNGINTIQCITHSERDSNRLAFSVSLIPQWISFDCSLIVLFYFIFFASSPSILQKPKVYSLFSYRKFIHMQWLCCMTWHGC